VLLAVDLDGTLLDASGRPHDRDVRAIRAALTAGIRVTIVTGRLYSGTRAFVELLGLRGPVACADGSHLVHAMDHATLMHIGVRGGDAVLLRRAFADAGVATFVFAQDAIGHDPAGSPFIDYVATWSDDIRVAASVFEHEFWDAEEGVTAVVAVGTREQIASVVDALARDLPSAVLVAAFPMRRGRHAGSSARPEGVRTQTPMWAMIVRAAGGTKGTAVRWIAGREGIDLRNTVCVGDWINDVPMFEVAGRSFAMAQAPDEVKAKASDLLEASVEHGGGVAEAVEKAFGIRGF
jgi:hydroxymethylpyrimidine pyrophosphatase-like HAD family hydrolase